MNTITIIFLISLLHKCISKDCVIDNRPKETAWEEKLRKDILCNYQANKQPTTNGTDAVKVSIKFIMKSFKLDVEKQEFSSYMLMVVSWDDGRLKWNTNDYDGISKTSLLSYKIWIPSIELHNSITDIYDKQDLLFPCEIMNNGRVECLALINFKTKCYTNFTNWPFDSQKCSLLFGPVHVKENKIKFDLSKRAISMIRAEYGAEWDIMDYQQHEDQNSDTPLQMTFELQRHANCLTAIILYPSIILTILTISCMVLDVRDSTRLYLGLFSLLCHFIFLTELGYEIYNESAYSPTILFYYRGSVVLTIIVIGMTLILSILCEQTKPAPAWILSINEYVFKSRGRLIVWPQWRTDSVNSEVNSVEKWNNFASIVNFVCMFVIVVVYAALFIAYMPRPSADFYY